MQAIAADLVAGKEKLRKVKTQENRTEKGDSIEDLSPEQEQKIRETFFDAGVENWLPLLGELSFRSTSIDLSRASCEEISKRSISDGGKHALESEIDERMAEKGWDRVFVKLSTRSPKDSPVILSKAAKIYKQRGGDVIPDLLQRVTLLAQAVQESFSVRSGREAVELLLSSERVAEDLEYALQAPNFEKLGLRVVIRQWEGAIPISNEFRGIVWDGTMNALGQYFHPLVFPDTLKQKEQIEADIRAVHSKLRPLLAENGFKNYILDFAWLSPGEVKIIELNPFDGVALGCFPGSTGLFLWDSPRDKTIITQGPFEFRMRTTELPDHELKDRLERKWKDIIL